MKENKENKGRRKNEKAKKKRKKGKRKRERKRRKIKKKFSKKFGAEAICLDKNFFNLSCRIGWTYNIQNKPVPLTLLSVIDLL